MRAGKPASGSGFAGPGVAVHFAGSGAAGFLVSGRRLLRRRALLAALVAAAAAFVMGWTLSHGIPGRRAAWIAFVMLFAPLFAVGVGAFGGQVLRGRRGVAPLAATPLSPAGWVVGQGAALAVAVLLATAVMLAPGGAFFLEGLKPARQIGAPRVEGGVIVDHGRRWARAGEGALAWTLPALGAGAWDVELRFATAFYPSYQGGPIVVRVDGPGGLHTRVTTRTEAPIHVRLPQPLPGGVLTLSCETAGVATAAIGDGARLVAADPAGGAPGWLAFCWLVAAHGLLLGAAALAASLLVSPPIAVLAALTLWLVGWASRFLAAYADAADVPSVFAAWSGTAAEPVAASAWLDWFAVAIRRLPDLSGAAVTDALGRGHLPEWGRVLTATGPHLAMALVLILTAAAVAARTWKRNPGRIPGERGLF